MITGYLCAAMLLLLLVKFIARKSGAKKFNQVMRRIHKPLGVVLIAAVVLHLILTIPVWDTRAASVIITGCVTAVLIIAMTITYLLRKKYPKTWFRWHRIGAVSMIVLLAAHIAVYFIDFSDYQNKIAQMEGEGITAEQTADGTYIGKCDAGYINATVSVTVKDGTIAEIKLLEHNNERGAKAKAVVDEILAEQTTSVDAVSGATNSSKVIMQAVKNALQSGIREDVK